MPRPDHIKTVLGFAEKSGMTQSASKQRVLIIEKVEAFRTAVKTEVERMGFSVELGNDATLASSPESKIRLILSDVRLPETAIPVVLMVPSDELAGLSKEKSSAWAALLPKPFKRKDLADAIGKALLSQKIQRDQSSAEDYCKISIDDFVSGRHLHAGVFVRLPDGAFVKIANQGEDLTDDRMKQYRSKGIRFLYLHRSEFRKFLEQNQVISVLKESEPSLSSATRAEWLQQAQEILQRKFGRSEGTRAGQPHVGRDALENGMALVSSVLSVLSDSPTCSKLVETLRAMPVVYEHSLSVVFFSSMIARRLKWNSPVTIHKIGFAALFHDIGLQSLKPEWSSTDRDEMSPEDKEKMTSHCSKGLEILAGAGAFSEEIVQGVLQHHENSAGTGYPSNMMKSKIQPIAKLLCVADQMAERVDRGDGISQALKHLYGPKHKRFDHLYLEALALALGGDLKHLQTLEKKAA